VIDNGVPVQLRLVGGSMEPTLPRGSTVRTAALRPSDVLEVGDVVVIATQAGQEVIVHRVLHTFVESGGDFIVHQGDAPQTSFAVASRQQVLARVIAVGHETSHSYRPIGQGDRCRFAARRLVSRSYLVARLFVDRIGVSPPPALRRAGGRLRSIAARSIGLPALQIRQTLRQNVRTTSVADLFVGETSVRALARRIIFGK
jgi:hypothetical protein